MNNITSVLYLLSKIETGSATRINLTPSENVLSPLARLPFALDAYGRYFLDDLRLFGEWAFPAGKDIGELEYDFLMPLLSEMGRAKYVNVRPISGISCMTIALAALTSPGDLIYCVPADAGGHPSTAKVAARLGLMVREIPFLNAFDIDYEKLAEEIGNHRPAMIYIDQSTFLFPVDPTPIRIIIERKSAETILYYDSSHINGLILSGAIFNPGACGAHVYGGSTHKTLPGPHKGFLATDDPKIAERIQHCSDHFVSHHHSASVLSLAITLAELKDCGGEVYANNVLLYAKLLGTKLAEEGYEVVGKERGFSGCHQLWAAVPEVEIGALTSRLYDAALCLNRFPALPGTAGPGLRLSVAEITRLGATESEISELAGIFGEILRADGDRAPESARNAVRQLRRKLDRPRYCYSGEELTGNYCAASLRYLENLSSSAHDVGSTDPVPDYG